MDNKILINYLLIIHTDFIILMQNVGVIFPELAVEHLLHSKYGRRFLAQLLNDY
jgi:hypothetical protein